MAGDDDSRFDSARKFLLGSVLKAARANTRFVPYETKNVNLATQLKGVHIYFKTIQDMMDAKSMELIGIDISIPSYKVKYAEYVRKVTFIYPEGAGTDEDDYYR